MDIIDGIPVGAIGPSCMAVDLGPIADDVQGVPAAQGLRLMGITVTEWAGDVAEIIVRNGTANTDPRLLSNITLNNAESVRDVFGDGLAADDGIFVQIVGGQADVVLLTNGVS